MKIRKMVLGAIMVMLLSVLFCFGAGAVEYYEDGDYVFEVNTEENYAAIYLYDGTDSVVKIPSYYNSYPVKVISGVAFIGSKTLESVVIPESVEFIENAAFSFCVNLKTVTLEGNITEIPDGCFQYCYSLEKVILPDSVNKIGENAFKFCFALTDFEFDESLEEISEQAFYGVNTNEYLLIKNKQLIIGEKAIGYIISEEDKPKVYAVTDFFFNYIVQPDDTWESVLTLLGEKLEAVENINPICKLQRIYGYANSGAKIYATANGIDFYNTDSYTDENGLIYSLDVNDFTAKVTGYGGEGAEVVIPSKVADFTVTEIGKEAFLWNENIINVTIPNTVTAIGEWTFANCTKLENVEFGDNLVSIGNEAFCFCSSLESIKLPDSLKTIGNRAFALCTNLENVVFGDLLTSIGKEAFGFCASLKDFVLPGSLREINNEAFFGCTAIENIVIPSSVEVFGAAIFGYCPKLKSAEIKSEISRVPDAMFAYCYSLEEVVLPETVNAIGCASFANCLSLENIPYNDRITTVEMSAFVGTGAKQIIIKNKNLEIGEGAIGYIFDDKDIETVKRYTDLEILLAYSEEQYDELEKELEVLEEEMENMQPALDQFTIYGYTGSTAEEYANANGIKFVSLDEACPHTGGEATCENKAVCTICGKEYGELADHTPVEITTQPTCTADGVKITTCQLCGEMLGYEVLYSEGHDKDTKSNNDGTHTVSCKVDNCTYSEIVNCSYTKWNIITPATCTENGQKEKECTVCSYKVYEEISSPGHKMDRWNITKEATLLDEGSRTRKCTVCTYSETENIAKLVGNITTDDKSGVEIKYSDASYDGKEMEVKVEEDYTGTQYIAQSLGVEYSGTVSFNIKTYVDGVEVQPSEPVLVRIPLPAGFNPDRIAVYHTNTKTGVFERITPVYIKDGFIEFLATSFSIYTAVDESTEIIAEPETPEEPAEECTCNCHKDGFMGIIWKILKFFYKIFGMNKVCECGAAHY